MTQTYTTPRPTNKRSDNTNVLIIAVIMGVVAVGLNLLYLFQSKAGKISTADFYVLTRRVGPGDVFKRNDFKSVNVPNQFAKTLKGLHWVGEDIDNYVDHHVEIAGAEGDPVTTDLFYSDNKPGVDVNILPGDVAISLPVNSRTAPGLLKKGMWVDISAPFNLGSSVATVLLIKEGVRVVALGTNSMYDDDDPSHTHPSRSFSTITIEVKPAEMLLLQTITNLAVGEFELGVRNPNDSQFPILGTPDINPAVIELIAKLRAESPLNPTPSPAKPKAAR